MESVTPEPTLSFFVRSRETAAVFLRVVLKSPYPSHVVRFPTSRRGPHSALIRRAARCVVCGTERAEPGRSGGAGSQRDFICADCGDPLEATLYCERCGRRLRLHEEAAAALLREYGLEQPDVRGLVFKVTGCSRCMSDDETCDVSIYRIQWK